MVDPLHFKGRMKIVPSSRLVGMDNATALVHSAGLGMVGCSSLSGSDRSMPHKHNADRRHHIPKMSFRGAELGRPTRQACADRAASPCGSRTQRWNAGQTTGPSGQARYTGAAIQTSLMLRVAFKLPLRQIEGLMTSVLLLMGLTISAPDHTVSRPKAVTLLVIQATSVPHGPLHVLIDSTGLQVYTERVSGWRRRSVVRSRAGNGEKLHLAVDAASSMIVAQTLTDQDTDDPVSGSAAFWIRLTIRMAR